MTESSAPLPIDQATSETPKYTKYAAIKVSPTEIQEAIKAWATEGHGAPYILAQLRTKYNYSPAIAAIGAYLRKWRKQQKVAPTPPPVSLGDPNAAKALEAVRNELSSVGQLLANLPSTSEKATVLKSIIGKCVDRILVIEQEPFDAKMEQALARYLSEIRENISLLTKLSEQELSETKLAEAVQAEFGTLLETVKDVIAEVCPEHLETIKERLKLKLQSFANGEQSTEANPRPSI